MKRDQEWIDVLLSHGQSIGPPLGPLRQLPAGLLRLLGRRNGAYLFGGSLRLRPSHTVGAVLGIDDWNDLGCWKEDYDIPLNGYCFFGEDTFGTQFCMDVRENIHWFEPETGTFEWIAETVPSFARWVMHDIDHVTGRTVLGQWEREHGPLPAGHRLFPKIPFVCGGEFTSSNLASCSDVDSMRFRGALARQIRDLEDGKMLVLRVTE